MPNVSLQVMEESKGTIRTAYQNLAETQYPEFQESCTAIYNRVNDTFNTTNNTIIEIKAFLDTTSALEGLNRMIKNKQEELETETDPAEIENIQNTINRLREEGDEKLNENNEAITSKATTLTNESSNIEFFDFKQQVDEEIQELNDDLVRIDGDIAEYEEKKKKAEEDYETLNVAMDVYEEYNIFEFFSDVIPTAEEISNMIDAGDPRLAAAILALEIYKDLFDVVGDGFSYMQMDSARDYVYNLITEYTRELERLNGEKNQININLNDLSHISTIESERFIFTEQVKNLSQGYTIYTEDIQSLMNTDVNYDNVLIRMGEMFTYLNNLSLNNA
ncbi:hypothetical protein PCC7424_3041 [Gloeothece citriformis PCC 7424]|uniref:Uncharacterized protein n=2 Tax=Gloeothece TaxID=28070 RepID=B7KB87_GLOC7|nr:hypothetical protein PCC7424_3041 [Gloeothece citriformis PCC 7424]